MPASQLGDQFKWILNHGKWPIEPKSSRTVAARGLQSRIQPQSEQLSTASPADR